MLHSYLLNLFSLPEAAGIPLTVGVGSVQSSADGMTLVQLPVSVSQDFISATNIYVYNYF